MRCPSCSAEFQVASEFCPACNAVLAVPAAKRGMPAGLVVLIVAGVGVVGVLVLGLLATLVVPKAIEAMATAEQVQARAGMVRIQSALTAYAVQNGGRYPDSLDVLILPDENGVAYLPDPRMILDPWQNEYAYEPPGAGRPAPRLISYGADGVPGGNGPNADVSHANR